jgi:ABC-2 type transport system ATP-binding protein
MMIKTDALTKTFGSLTAVDNLSLQCEKGEVLGFLGPNGAGKSTTMKMIAGFVTPTSGTAEVCGYDVLSHPVQAKQRLGYLPEGAPSYPEMTPLGVLEFVADIRGMSGDHRKRRLDEVIGQLHLSKILYQSFETLSKGFKRRVALAQSLLHDPDVLILDEPTDGLDPNQKHEVRELIRSMSAEKLIIISTHILEEVEAVCSRAMIIADGKMLADDSPEGLLARSRYHNSVRFEVDGSIDLGEVTSAIEALKDVASAEQNQETRTITALASTGQKPLKDVTKLLADRDWSITDIQVESGNLEDVFRDITGGISQ